MNDVNSFVLTETIIGYTVANALGNGFLEKCTKTLANEVEKENT